MGDELPILKGILNGVVNYHNARRCLRMTFDYNIAQNEFQPVFIFFSFG